MSGNERPGSVSPTRRSVERERLIASRDEMRAYDQLPVRLRRAMAEAPHRFSASAMHEFLVQRGEEFALEMLEHAVERERLIASRDMRDGSGPFALRRHR